MGGYSFVRFTVLTDGGAPLLLRLFQWRLDRRLFTLLFLVRGFLVLFHQRRGFFLQYLVHAIIIIVVSNLPFRL